MARPERGEDLERPDDELLVSGRNPSGREGRAPTSRKGAWSGASVSADWRWGEIRAGEGEEGGRAEREAEGVQASGERDSEGHARREDRRWRSGDRSNEREESKRRRAGAEPVRRERERSERRQAQLHGERGPAVERIDGSGERSQARAREEERE